jgi:hypothetical protein
MEEYPAFMYRYFLIGGDLSWDQFLLRLSLRIWYDLRKALGLTPLWYHSTTWCREHWVPRIHKVTFPDNDPMVELCSKGNKNYFTGEKMS